ncbi:metal ABC transporter permease [Oceanibium sediminis]|uniref:metal ABC transporter permease n=1 Tax=Oceanibium sediminis TaxID=2026339 RepID=UPI000DD48594|nr:metal ABC transporter permease [Oceanibium sediminis]
MLDDFLVRATLAGLAVALAAGPLGAFVVWRRMAYFGDATAHAAILGVALSLAFSVSIFIGVAAVAAATALIITALSGRGTGVDTVLGVVSHGALAAGLIAVSFLPGVRADLMGYLFGDILAVGRSDLLVIWGGAALVLGVMLWRWQPLLLATMNADLAAARHIDPKREQLILTLALAALVAVALQVIGALLITAMLIIPAAAARPLARSPEAMAALGSAIAALATILGLQLSAQMDTPAGPSIIIVAVAIFLVTTLVSGRR